MPIALLIVFCFPYFFIFACSSFSFCVDRLLMFSIFRNRPPIALLFVFCFLYFFIFACSSSSFRVDRLFMFPIFRNRPPIALLFLSASLTSPSLCAAARLSVLTDCSCSLYSGTDRLLHCWLFSASLTPGLLREILRLSA
jgi:hypothetical protein